MINRQNINLKEELKNIALVALSCLLLLYIGLHVMYRNSSQLTNENWNHANGSGDRMVFLDDLLTDAAAPGASVAELKQIIGDGITDSFIPLQQFSSVFAEVINGENRLIYHLSTEQTDTENYFGGKISVYLVVLYEDDFITETYVITVPRETVSLT